MLSMTLTINIVSAPVGKWIDQATYKPPLISGLILMLIACGMMAWTQALTLAPYLIFSLFLAGVLAAFLIPATATDCFQMVKPEKAGVAMGVLFTCGFLGNSFGVAISGSIMDEHSIMKVFSYAMIVCAILVFLSLFMSLAIPKETSAAP